MPKADFRRVVDDIAARIRSGELRPGTVLPSGGELAAQYDVSRSTVDRAMTILIDRGLIEGHAGKSRRVTNDPGQ